MKQRDRCSGRNPPAARQPCWQAGASAPWPQERLAQQWRPSPARGAAVLQAVAALAKAHGSGQQHKQETGATPAPLEASSRSCRNAWRTAPRPRCGRGPVAAAALALQQQQWDLGAAGGGACFAWRTRPRPAAPALEAWAGEACRSVAVVSPVSPYARRAWEGPGEDLRRRRNAWKSLEPVNMLRP